jgi:hypothetical protein
MTTEPPVSRETLAARVYLAFHYDPATGALLRNGKVNGSETRALAAAKLLDLVDAGLVRTARGILVVEELEGRHADPVLETARAALAGQRKPRSATWCLDNLGSVGDVVAGLVASGLVVAERKPGAPLPEAGLAALQVIVAELDSGDDAEAAAVLFAGDVWRNVWSGRPREENQAIAARLSGLARESGLRGENAHARRAVLAALAESNGVALG